MKFIFGFQVVPTIFIIALTGITNSKVVRSDFPNVESNLNYGLMTGEAFVRVKRESEDGCNLPQNLPNSSWLRHYNDARRNPTILELSCNDGYRMHFGADIFCNGEGEWSHEPQCVANDIENVQPPYKATISLIFCSPPSDRDNGHWRYRNSATMKCPHGQYCHIPDLLMFWGYGAQLHQICDAGYENRAIFYCNPNIGRWVSRPTCVDINYRPGIPGRGGPPKVHCNIPSQPRNGRYLLAKSQCQNGQHCNIPEGVTKLYAGVHLMLSCNDGYKVNGTADVFCGSDGKLSNDPECIEIRCKALSTDSTSAECTYNNAWISCASPVPLGTIATVSCRGTYRPVSEGIFMGPNTLKCIGNGEWNEEPMKCTLDCGKIYSGNDLKIAGGQPVKIPEFPWHATLYKSDQNGNKTMVCGATIIQRDLLITAAHCVFDESTNRVEEANRLAVATGNVFRDFDSPLHQTGVVQKANVKRIVVNPHYTSYQGNYDWDIAILQIEHPFTFSAISRPACLDFSDISERFVLEPGQFGKFAGFGKTAKGHSSHVLQTLTIPVVSLNDCKNASKIPENERFITTDKFCAGYRNGSSACDGDSGGGLVFRARDLWHLRGIISSGFGDPLSNVQSSCEKGTYTLFTRIAPHGEWIQKVIKDFGRA